MKLKPLFDKVVVEEIEEKKEKLESGILLPDSAKEKPSYAKVIAVGEGGYVGEEKVEMKVKVNDNVIFCKYAGTEFKINNKKYIVLKQDDILAIVE